MGEEIQVPPCAKCGHTDSTIEYKQIVTPGDVYAVDPELLWAQCCRCGYRWTMPTLDATPRERPTAREDLERARRRR